MIRHFWQKLISTTVIVGSLVFPTHVRADYYGNLTVEIHGLKNQQGQICFSLFDSYRGFPSQGKNAINVGCVKITDSNPKLVFNHLKAGNYALAVFHDVKGDRILKRHLGIPTEGFGFSNNPTILTGTPKFDEASVFVLGSQNIQINLIYLF